MEELPDSPGKVRSRDMTASLCRLQSSPPPSDGDPLLSKLASSTKMAADERRRDEQHPSTSPFQHRGQHDVCTGTVHLSTPVQCAGMRSIGLLFLWYNLSSYLT